MPSEAPEAPIAELPVDQAVPADVTETPATEEVAEGAAQTPETAATELQVEIEQKPESLTREEVERLIEERAEKIRADEREAERRRRQTEGARRAAAEKREAEERAELVDSIRAAFIEEQGVAPPTEKIAASVDRFVRKRADQLANGSLETVEQAWEYITAPIYGTQVELDAEAEAAARRLSPKVQHLINQMVPQIEAKAREGYVHKDELPKLVDAEIARRQAKGREGQEELQRPQGQPASTDTSTVEERLDRLAKGRPTEGDRQWWNEREKARGRG